MNSMTGYGRAKVEKEERQYIIEIKSVNHKYSDINIKIPKNISFLEDKVRKTILSKISRGKIDVFVSYTNYGVEGKNVVLNKKLAELYIEQIKELAEETNIEKEIKVTDISKLPDVLNISAEEENSEIIWKELLECLEESLNNFMDMRLQEGMKIKADLTSRIKRIEKFVNKIKEYSTLLVEEYVVKLKERIKEVLSTDIVDETRLAQEVVIYSDKCSIEEEITRLNSHIYQFNELLKKEEPIGKKLDFLIQEMNRETNTIGSKSTKLEITNLVIEIKTELEDIREQIQNIE